VSAGAVTGRMGAESGGRGPGAAVALVAGARERDGGYLGRRDLSVEMLQTICSLRDGATLAVLGGRAAASRDVSGALHSIFGRTSFLLFSVCSIFLAFYCFTALGAIWHSPHRLCHASTLEGISHLDFVAPVAEI
jgi:hypothetical protein